MKDGFPMNFIRVLECIKEDIWAFFDEFYKTGRLSEDLGGSL